MTPEPCPFCGEKPSILPERPETHGNAWGEVVCVNEDCPTFDPLSGRGVGVRDGEDISDDRGSDAYKAAAVTRWDKALAGTRHQGGARNDR